MHVLMLRYVFICPLRREVITCYRVKQVNATFTPSSDPPCGLCAIDKPNMTTPVITPRLRMTRTPLHYDRDSQIASTSHTGGPSRLTEFSQLVDVDLDDMELPDPSDHSITSKISTPSTATRSEKPAAVLRALLSRLPDHRNLTPSQSPSQQYPSERESDYDISEPANATPSMAQESLKDIFSKARRDPGSTPQKIQARRNSVGASEVDASFSDASCSVEEERMDSKGKRRSVSDDETEHLDSKPPGVL